MVGTANGVRRYIAHRYADKGYVVCGVYRAPNKGYNGGMGIWGPRADMGDMGRGAPNSKYNPKNH